MPFETLPTEEYAVLTFSLGDKKYLANKSDLLRHSSYFKDHHANKTYKLDPDTIDPASFKAFLALSIPDQVTDDDVRSLSDDQLLKLCQTTRLHGWTSCSRLESEISRRMRESQNAKRLLEIWRFYITGLTTSVLAEEMDKYQDQDIKEAFEGPEIFMLGFAKYTKTILRQLELLKSENAELTERYADLEKVHAEKLSYWNQKTKADQRKWDVVSAEIDRMICASCGGRQLQLQLDEHTVRVICGKDADCNIWS